MKESGVAGVVSWSCYLTVRQVVITITVNKIEIFLFIMAIYYIYDLIGIINKKLNSKHKHIL
jgi:hypothetical protein